MTDQVATFNAGVLGAGRTPSAPVFSGGGGSTSSGSTSVVYTPPSAVMSIRQLVPAAISSRPTWS